MKIYSLTHISIMFALTLNLSIQTQTNAQPTSIDRLNTAIEELKKDSTLAHASWGICVLQSKTGEVLTEYNSNISLTPASTQKIITTAAGLSLLGPNYTYQTALEYDGIFDSISGTIKGSLYIKGGGDPTLGSMYFKDKNDSTPIVKKWADILKAKGIKTIEGSIIADASVFDDEMIPSNWIWGDLGNYYGAGASGLTYMDNVYTLYFKSGNAKDTARITKMVPDIPNIKISNYVKSGGTEDNAYIYGAPYSDYRYVVGTIPPNKTDFDVRGTMPDPPYFLAYSLKQALTDNGIQINGYPISVRQLKLMNIYQKSPRKKIYIHYSPQLSKIVYWTNLISNNLFAEHVLKAIALQKRGWGGESLGIDEVIKFWSSKGIDTKGMNLYDGCGLARANTITPKQLALAFRVMTLEPVYTTFYNSLPIAGKTGTMTSLCRGSCAENNMRAKSGSITKVRSFAGYVNNKKGEQLCFSIISNNFDCSSNEMKKKMEKLMVLIAELD
jgi:D-alanyl-D-alanine carboxypeptidase/D-alanyl-D-alanine-endopeptidase (penicillin-binding protein 4)